VDFLDLEDDTSPALSPEALARRYGGILETAIRLTRQMPNNHLEDQLPNRPRSWLVLMHHVFQIPIASLDMEEKKETLTYETTVASPPENMKTVADIAAFGEAVRRRFHAWWKEAEGTDFSGDVPTYFGATSRHEMLERTVWHSTQHVRQIASLLEQADVTPDRPLGLEDIQGLPLTEKVWDEV